MTLVAVVILIRPDLELHNCCSIFLMVATAKLSKHLQHDPTASGGLFLAVTPPPSHMQARPKSPLGIVW